MAHADNDSPPIPGLEEAFLRYLSELGDRVKPTNPPILQQVDKEFDKDDEDAWLNGRFTFDTTSLHQQTVFSLPGPRERIDEIPGDDARPQRDGSSASNAEDPVVRPETRPDKEKVGNAPTPDPPAESDPTKGLHAIVEKLTAVFKDVPQYRFLLRRKGDQAQKLLDFFQKLLYTPALETRFRRQLVVAVQRLSQDSGLYPTCFRLDNVQLEGEHPVAAGSFGDIYKGNIDGNGVCLKAIRVYQASRVDYLLKRFAQEVILWGQLSHPNLLPFYGLYRFRSQLCLISPWMENGDVVSYLEFNPNADRVLLASDITAGVSYLHANDIIHGDLKGANILVTNTGRACVADFGLSSVTDAQILKWTSHSSAGSKGGSLRWQAPELFDIDDLSILNTKASDIYALSCVFYEVFTGTIPFPDVPRDSAVMLRVRAGARPARPLAEARARWGLTDAIWALMQDCWLTDPEGRPLVREVATRLAAGDSAMSEGGREDVQLASMACGEFRAFVAGPGGTGPVLLESDLDALLGAFRRSSGRGS